MYIAKLVPELLFRVLLPTDISKVNIRSDARAGSIEFSIKIVPRIGDVSVEQVLSQ